MCINSDDENKIFADLNENYLYLYFLGISIEEINKLINNSIQFSFIEKK